MTPIPCAHLMERSTGLVAGEEHPIPAHCCLGRDYPRECQRCSAYSPGITLQERRRAEDWAATYSEPPPRRVDKPSASTEPKPPTPERPLAIVSPGQVVMPPPGEHPQPSAQAPRVQAQPPANPPRTSYTFAEGAGHD